MLVNGFDNGEEEASSSCKDKVGCLLDYLIPLLPSAPIFLVL